MRSFMRQAAFAAFAGLAAGAATAADNVRIAFIDPLSGPFASTGTNGLHQFEFAAEKLVNEKGGVLGGRKFEIVPFDNKISPKESLIQLQVAIDQGIRYIVQGNSSGVANALTEAIEKHNKRNPDKRVLFLNYSAVDPALTNDKCNFWHFRFDANADIKMDALTDVIKQNDAIKKVYVIGQDYSFGKAVAAAAQRFLAEKRPDIEIVGNELHPIGKVKDFTPYARKIIASGADAVITGNWGADMLGLGKAIIEAGFKGPIYTYYAAADGITAAFGESGKGILRLVSEGQLNPPPSDRVVEYARAFKEKYPDGNLSQTRIANVIEMLARAIEQAGSAEDVVAVGKALEGMEHDSLWGGKLFMRPQDHQLIQDVHILVHTNEGVTFDFDNSGYGLVVESTVKMASMDAPTTCKMKRP
ncbi:branched-chain amino acid ABC transporter substrate-binding protein [Oceanicella actignis]|uniref:branched-chain amino acid ABC transporter substrate-binding protein n=1 Tax=Oceanicella actignis TaxID=1189325 RepID=UPI0011E79C92|nr:branched-chain amino acid ABC transporter substrate-binding protein [Oceanicella actignis]TYO84647.1 branched-chain amino acid transport system substrate-binding protein [Oceanicella actignis]